MKFIHFLPMMLVQSIIVALAALVSADNKTQNNCTGKCPCIPHCETKKKKDPKAYALISAYVMATAILLVFIPWFLWRIIRNWGSWKIHTESPRPQYIRTSFGWVDLETWQQKQAKQARRKEAKRDQHTIYRTTKANYKWIFYDPTGDLQQRFNQQKERSHLRFLPSWMRSYPHGTLQSGISAQQSKASNKIYQLPNLHINEKGCLSNLESFGNLQLDGSPMSGAFPDPYYSLPNLSKMDYHDAITPNTSGKSYSLPILPVMNEPDVVQVWINRGNNAGPERTGSPPLESEEELRGEVESAEEVMRLETEHRLEIGHRYELMALDDFALQDANRLMPYAWPDPPNLTSLEIRSQPYIEYLESRISLLEQRLRGFRVDHIPRPIRRTLDTYIQELQRVTGVRRPEPRPLPPLVRYAIELQQFIADLKERIKQLRKQPEDVPLHDTLDDLINKLRKAELRWDRLPPIHDLPPPIPTSRHQLELHQIFRPRPKVNDAAEPEPRPRVLPGVGIIVETPDARANTVANDDYNFMTELQGELHSPDIPGVQTSATTRDTFSDLFRGHPTRHVSASSPTIVAPQTHGEVNHEAIEDLAMDDNTTPGPVSRKRFDEGGNRTITEGTNTDGSCNPNPTSEDELRPDTRNPIAAAPPGSPPNCNADLEQADSVAQPSRLVRQRTPWANLFTSQRGRPDPTPDVGSQEVQMETDAAPIDDDDDGGGPSSSVASGPNPPATTATRESTTMAPVSPDVDDALIEELYSDRY